MPVKGTRAERLAYQREYYHANRKSTKPIKGPFVCPWKKDGCLYEAKCQRDLQKHIRQHDGEA